MDVVVLRIMAKYMYVDITIKDVNTLKDIIQEEIVSMDSVIILYIKHGAI